MLFGGTKWAVIKAEWGQKVAFYQYHNKSTRGHHQHLIDKKTKC